jgi:hypothetical protein
MRSIVDRPMPVSWLTLARQVPRRGMTSTVRGLTLGLAGGCRTARGELRIAEAGTAITGFP